MKNLKYILVPALTGLLFVACNTEPKGPTQAELDTQVEAKVNAATEQLNADCNTRIMQAAQMQADSIIAKTSAKKAAPKPVAAPAPPKPKTVKTPPPPPPAPPKPTIGNGKPKMGGNSNPNEVGNGKPKMGGTKDEKGKVDETKIGNGKPKMGGGK